MRILRIVATALCALTCAVGSAATKSHEGLKYSTTAVTPGVWTTQFSKAKRYAEKQGIPLVVLWVNPGCGYCRALCSSISASSSFAKWQKSSGYMFVLGIGNKTSSGKKAKAFAKTDGRTTLSSFPYCAVYLNPRGAVSPTLKKVFAGRSSGSGMTADAFRRKILSSRSKYAKISLKAGKGGSVSQVRWQKIGKKVPIKAVSNRGYRFVAWYDKKGKQISKKAYYKLKITKSATYKAVFKYELKPRILAVPAE